jgi:hypothetical protein
VKKGDLVRLNNGACFTEEHGGKLRYPLINYYNDGRGTVEASRPITGEEQAVWYQSDASKGLDSAGETKLPPQATHVLLYKDRLYQVLRARCRARLGWGNPTGGLVKLLCTHTGETAYVKRELVEVAK